MARSSDIPLRRNLCVKPHEGGSELERCAVLDAVLQAYSDWLSTKRGDNQFVECRNGVGFCPKPDSAGRKSAITMIDQLQIIQPTSDVISFG